MRANDIEIWAREVVSAVLSGQPVEDTRVELKANWIDHDKAARQLAGQANASHGEPVLWIVGVDERNSRVAGVDPMEFENWHKQVERWFDGFAPPLITHVNVRIDYQTIVALYFETERYAPYVITNPQGGYPEFSVPWRDGTRLRAARREDLLHLLTPIVKQPRIRLATAELTLTILPSLGGSQQRHDWRFEALVYITPADETRVVLPYGQCLIWMNVEGYGTYRLWASFNSLNANLPQKPVPHSINIMGKDVDITPPPPRESFTIRCADSELIADGPGSARLLGNGYVLRDELSPPPGNVSTTIEITPSNSERRIVLEATLGPVKNQLHLGSSFTYHWKS